MHCSPCLASVQGGYLYVNVSANGYVELDRKCLRQSKNKIEPQRDKDTLMMTNESVEERLKLWKVRLGGH